MRDLIGYGGKTPAFVWPNGARLAISLVVNFEEGAEQQVGDGDPATERIGEVLSVVEPGTRDMGQEQIFAYGMRAGLWRFLEALETRRLPATFFCCGRAIERVPVLAAEITRRGHEPACHGWRWRPHADYRTREEEAADLEPLHPHHRGIHRRTPLRLLLPRQRERVDAPAPARARVPLHVQRLRRRSPLLRPQLAWRALLVVPYALDSNDMKFFHPNGFSQSSEFVSYVRDAVDVLLAEADRGKSRLLNLGFHLRISGRPGRFRAVEQILDMVQGLGSRAWVARRIDIARHALVTMPAT